MYDTKGSHITISDYSATHFAIRKNKTNIILLGKSLLHQFAIELNHMIEVNELDFMKF